MHRRFRALLLLVGVVGLVGPGHAADESREPVLAYSLEIDGQPHDILLDTPVTLPGSHTDPVVVLRAAATRRFAYGGVAFEYPAAFTWEAEIRSPTDRTWTISGNDCRIMVFVLPEAMSVGDYARAMEGQFGKGKTRIGDTTRIFSGTKREGKRLDVEVTGVKLNFEMFALPSAKGSRILLFQSSPPDDRPVSRESGVALSLLETTLVDTESERAPGANDETPPAE